MSQQIAQVKFDERVLEELSTKIATEVSDNLYYELLMARYIPEIKSIESGKIKALEGKKGLEYIKQKISSLK